MRHHWFLASFYKLLLYIVLLVLAGVFIGPFLFLLSNSLKPEGSNIFVYPPKIIPNPLTFENYVTSFIEFPFLRYALNSVIITISIVAFNLILCSLVAYPLARIRFRGNKFVFYAILSTMMIPFHSIMIALFITIVKLHLLGTYLGVILPFAISGFGVFMLRQAFLGIPDELEDAARIDGCDDFRIYYQIMLPLVQPALGTLALYTFVISWNEFLWPTIILKESTMWTLQQGLASLNGMFGINWTLLSAATVLSMVPIIIVFLFLQRFFLEDYAAGAIKG